MRATRRPNAGSLSDSRGTEHCTGSPDKMDREWRCTGAAFSACLFPFLHGSLVTPSNRTGFPATSCGSTQIIRSADKVGDEPSANGVPTHVRGESYGFRKWGRWDSNPEPTDYESA